MATNGAATNGASGPTRICRAAPALSLNRRLQACLELPSWAMYLPAELQENMQANARHRLLEEDHTSSFARTKNLPTLLTQQRHSGNDINELRSQGHCSDSSRTLGKLALDAAPGRGAARHSADACLPQPRGTSASATGKDSRAGGDGGAAMQPFIGRVWALSRDAQGCRDVQRALDEAPSEEARLALVMELQGHIWDAMRCPHANYVLQKIIALIRPQVLQFIVDEVVQKGARAIAQAARHKYGCRIIQRLLEHCTSDQVWRLSQGLLSDIIATSRHPYGNYVMQQLLEHGTAKHRSLLIQELQRHASIVGADEYACAVVGKAMVHGEFEQQMALARALVNVPGMLSNMARTRHGHCAARLVLQMLDGAEHERATSEIRADAAALRSSRYGRLVVAFLNPNSRCAQEQVTTHSGRISV